MRWQQLHHVGQSQEHAIQAQSELSYVVRKYVRSRVCQRNFQIEASKKCVKCIIFSIAHVAKVINVEVHYHF